MLIKNNFLHMKKKHLFLDIFFNFPKHSANFNNINSCQIMFFKFIIFLFWFRFSKYLNNFIFLNLNSTGGDFDASIRNCVLISNVVVFFERNFVFDYLFKQTANFQKKKVILQICFKKKMGVLKKKNFLKSNIFKYSFQLLKMSSNNFNDFWPDSSGVLNNFFNFSGSFSNFYGETPVVFNNLHINFKKVILNHDAHDSYFNEKSRKVFLRIHKKYNKKLYENRDFFKEIYFNRFTRQHKLTNFLSKIGKKTNIETLQKLQNLLYVILLNSQLFLFKSDVFFFLKTYGVFVNGILSKVPYKVLIPGDRVQLIIIDTFFFFFKKTRFLADFFLLKYKKKLFKLTLSTRLPFMQRSTSMPNWLYRLMYYYVDIPNSMEIDYTALTIIIIFNSNVFFDLNWITKMHISAFFVRLYNWRTLA